MWLKLRNIKKSYLNGNRRIQVLRGIDLEVNKGEKIAIVGPSGSGKTTLLNIIGTLDRPDEGEIFFEGRPIEWQNDAFLSHFRGKKLGFVFQFYHLMPELNVKENILLPGLMAGWERSKLEERVQDLLSRLSLEDKKDSRIYALSGGERQKVAIARAVFLYPELLLADEPTGNLDPESAKEVIELFLELNKTLHLSLIIVSHNMEIAKRMDKLYLLKEGFLVEYS
ncbi:MAG: ABC transporter ATP-binding protein [Caldimicrobium sp.]|nr:ABC transporter ATP-binding protein [Caldimicrobium sp.]MCX7873887.1 ABC transporter ATP-binding protein [Caldimicrobium sp.]MDW8094829.1 ABC transporter ATP-binding protein [Caldimicrobium sp.]